jgi:DNA-binding GntR family transcriptional regulator
VSSDDSTYARLRAAIVEGRYAPGERLIEVKLASELEASRGPIREALRRLDAEGLVVHERNRGAIVRPLTLAEVIDQYELRGRLEAYAAELAAQRATDDELSRLRTAADTFTTVRTDGAGDGIAGVRRLNDANRALHDMILEAAHHTRLSTLVGRTVDLPLVFRAFNRFGDAERERSDMFHHWIVEAIVARDATRASRLMAEHIALGRDAVVAGWSNSRPLERL